MRGKTRHHQIGFGCDVNALAVDAPRFKCVVFVVRHPPHVAVAVTGQQRVTGFGKFGGVFAPLAVGHHGLGNDLLARIRAAATHHLAKTCHVPQRCAQTAAAKGHTDRIDTDEGVFLAAEFLPDAFAEHFGQALPGDAFHDPAHELGVDGFVGESLTVFPFFLEGEEEVVEGFGAVVVCAAGAKTTGARVVPNVGLGVGIQLGIEHADLHVHHLTQGGVGIGGVGHFRHVMRDEFLVVQHAFMHQRGAQCGGVRLGDREAGMWGVGLHRALVFFIHAAALVQHHDGVGVGVGQAAGPDARAALHVGELQRIDGALAGGIDGTQVTWGPDAAPHIDGGHQLPHVRECPAVLRKTQKSVISKTDLFVCRWR